MKYLSVIAIIMMVGMTAGFGGWDDSKTYKENIDAIFATNVIDFSDGPHDSSLNWSEGDKPVREVDGTPFVAASEQDVIDLKNKDFFGQADPYAQNSSRPKPVRTIDGSWEGAATEQQVVDKKVADFLR
jgi:hypothetical protein